MSCSWKRNRLVGSCMSTLVSRTKSLVGVARSLVTVADLRAGFRGAGNLVTLAFNVLSLGLETTV
jgi:hypothetical protein